MLGVVNAPMRRKIGFVAELLASPCLFSRTASKSKLCSARDREVQHTCQEKRRDKDHDYGDSDVRRSWCDRR
jgi:hypothetical protein